MINVHINMNDFTHASRVLKQVHSLIKYSVFDEIIIIALGFKNLPEFEQLSEKISLYRINLLTRGLPKNLLFQTIKYLEFFFKSFLLIAKAKPDVVNAHSLPVFPIALISKVLFKSRFVYDTHELETERNGLHGIRKKICKILEKKFIRFVDMTIVVSESIADWYADEYGIQRPLVVLNVPNQLELNPRNHFREKLGIREDQVILLYQGGLVIGRGLPFILEAFKSRDDDKIVVVFMGYGPLEIDVKSSAKMLDNIYFYPAVPPQELLEYTSSADVGISLIENTCLSYYFCMPNKLFEYGMAGLPVLVSDMKDMGGIVRQNKMGAVINNFSPDSINQALNEFLQEDLTQMKRNAYRVAIENCWEVQEEKMMDAYKTMFGKHEINDASL